MLIWPLLLSLISFAHDFAVEEYCFASEAKMKLVLDRAKFILVPADKVQTNQSCFTVSTPEHRRELIQSYVRRLDPAVGISFSSAQIKRDPCHLKVEKIKTVTTEALNGSVTIAKGFGVEQQQNAREIKEVSTIQTLKDFELSVNQDRILGECRSITPDRYEIVLQVKKEAKPLLPPVPPGTTVIVTNPPVATIQDTSNLTTTLQLTRGQRIEIGSFLKEKKDQGYQLELPQEGEATNKKSTESEKVYLQLD